MSDDWLNQLQQLHDADKAKRQSESDKKGQQKKEGSSTSSGLGK